MVILGLGRGLDPSGTLLATLFAISRMDCSTISQMTEGSTLLVLLNLFPLCLTLQAVRWMFLLESGWPVFKIFSLATWSMLRLGDLVPCHKGGDIQHSKLVLSLIGYGLAMENLETLLFAVSECICSFSMGCRDPDSRVAWIPSLAAIEKHLHNKF